MTENSTLRDTLIKKANAAVDSTPLSSLLDEGAQARIIVDALFDDFQVLSTSTLADGSAGVGADAPELASARDRALRSLHSSDVFGDCVEDGDPYPCKTMQVLDFRSATDSAA